MKLLVLVATLHDETRTASYIADGPGYVAAGEAQSQLEHNNYKVETHLVALPDGMGMSMDEVKLRIGKGLTASLFPEERSE